MRDLRRTMAVPWLTHDRSIRPCGSAARRGCPARWQADARRSASRSPTKTQRVLARARFDRTIGFLAAALLDGTVEASDDTLDAATSDWHRSLRGVVLVEAFAVRTAAVLDDAGVRWRLTKGAALAHLDYRDQLAERTFGDVDLMIHPDDWSAALDALGAAGLRRPAPELRPGYDRRFGKGATLVDEREWEIDLHLRFAIGRIRRAGPNGGTVRAGRPDRTRRPGDPGACRTRPAAARMPPPHARRVLGPARGARRRPARAGVRGRLGGNGCHRRALAGRCGGRQRDRPSMGTPRVGGRPSGSSLGGGPPDLALETRVRSPSSRKNARSGVRRSPRCRRSRGTVFPATSGRSASRPSVATGSEDEPWSASSVAFARR